MVALAIGRRLRGREASNVVEWRYIDGRRQLRSRGAVSYGVGDATAATGLRAILTTESG
jgi:hypothetical protein